MREHLLHVARARVVRPEVLVVDRRRLRDELERERRVAEAGAAVLLGRRVDVAAGAVVGLPTRGERSPPRPAGWASSAHAGFEGASSALGGTLVA